MKTSKITSKTIVLVHGLFVNPKSWSEWKAFFEQKGYTVHTPANPFHEGDPKTLRANAPEGLKKATFEDLVINLAKFIDTLPEKPILVGHSLGGLTVQKLLSMGKGVAAVAIDSAAPVGIIPTTLSFWKSNFPVINYFRGDAPFMATKDWFRYTFGNVVSREESDRAFDEYVVPEGRNVARSTLKSFAKIDFKKPHEPLLMIAGEKDNIIPSALNKSNFAAYKDKESIREFREFKGRGHYIVGEPGWEEVANYVADWLKAIR